MMTQIPTWTLSGVLAIAFAAAAAVIAIPEVNSLLGIASPFVAAVATSAAMVLWRARS
jgi:hypothetical protein